jgi:TonB family protein
MNALMHFTDSDAAPQPAMPFLRRRHLVSRVYELSKESRMSTRRLVVRSLILLLVVVGAAKVVASALPLETGAVTLGQGSQGRLEIRLAETQPGPDLTEMKVQGSGERLYVHATSVVTNADVSSAEVVQQGDGFAVSVRFSPGASTRLSAATAGHVGKPVAIVLDGQLFSAPVLRGAISDSAMITGTFTQAEAEAIAAALRPRSGAAPANQSGPFTSQDGGVVLPVAKFKVNPTYPEEAQAAKITGLVILQAIVLADGTVGDVTVTQSLDKEYGTDQASVIAVKQWLFEPGTKDGKPVDVQIHITINFTLAD